LGVGEVTFCLSLLKGLGGGLGITASHKFAPPRAV
jgi:hypothetical protein